MSPGSRVVVLDGEAGVFVPAVTVGVVADLADFGARRLRLLARPVPADGGTVELFRQVAALDALGALAVADVGNAPGVSVGVRGSLSVGEVASRLGCPARTVRYWCRAGRVAGAVQNGRRWFIPEDSMMALAAERTSHG